MPHDVRLEILDYFSQTAHAGRNGIRKGLIRRGVSQRDIDCLDEHLETLVSEGRLGCTNQFFFLPQNADGVPEMQARPKPRQGQSGHKFGSGSQLHRAIARHQKKQDAPVPKPRLRLTERSSPPLPGGQGECTMCHTDSPDLNRYTNTTWGEVSLCTRCCSRIQSRGTAIASLPKTSIVYAPIEGGKHR